MSTQTKTEENTKVEVIVTANSKVTAAIRSQLEASTIAESKKVATARVIRTEAARLGYTDKQTRLMVSLSWREARGFQSNSEKEIAAFDLRSRPDVSKVLALAYPANDKAQSFLEEAIAHNEKQQTKATRIGENRLLEIARGNLTFSGAISGKAPKRRPSNESKMPPQDRFGNRVAALYKEFVTSGLLKEADGKRLFAEYFVAPSDNESESES